MSKARDMIIKKTKIPLSISEQYPILYKKTKDSDWIKWEWGVMDTDYMTKHEKLGKDFKNTGARIDLLHLVTELPPLIVIAYALRFEESFYFKTDLVDTWTFNQGWSLSE